MYNTREGRVDDNHFNVFGLSLASLTVQGGEGDKTFTVYSVFNLGLVNCFRLTSGVVMASQFQIGMLPKMLRYINLI